MMEGECSAWHDMASRPLDGMEHDRGFDYVSLEAS